MNKYELTEEMNARERILAVAEEVFLTRGYEGVSIRELTDAAKVNVALVNYYFGGKRKLYLEVLQRKFRALSEEKCQLLEQALLELAEPDLRQVISCYVKLYLANDEQANTTRQFLRLISQQFSEDDDAMELLLQDLIKPIHQLTSRTIGAIAPQLSSEQISLCIGSINGQVFHYLNFPGVFQSLLAIPDKDRLREAVVDHVIEFSLKGLQEVAICDLIP